MRAYATGKEAGFAEPVSIRLRFLFVRLAENSGEGGRFAASSGALMSE
jgi:hypothetical protein